MDIQERVKLDTHRKPDLQSVKRRSRKQVHHEQVFNDLIRKPFNPNGFKAFAALFSCAAGFFDTKDRNDRICRTYEDHIDSCEVIGRFAGSDGARIAFISVKLKTAQHLGLSGMKERGFVSELLGDMQLDAVFAAFYCEGFPLWRLSLVRKIAGYELMGIEFEHAPVKSSSICAGESRLHHSIQKKLFQLFVHHGFNPSLREIENVFSQTDLAEDFIEEYCNKLQVRRQNEFQVKLQEKPQVRLQDKLQSKLQEDSSSDFLKDILGTLSNKFLKDLSKEPQEDSILAVLLNDYGFSVQESEHNDEITEIDANIFGVLFERLLSRNAKKRSGTFYTPPEIVRYMCIESISEYLANKTGAPLEELRLFLQFGEAFVYEDCHTPRDIRKGAWEGASVSRQESMPEIAQAGVPEVESSVHSKMKYRLPAGIFSRLNEIDSALACIKVLDPASGSGAFPLCILNEIVNARVNITEYFACARPSVSQQEIVELRKARHPFILKYHAVTNCLYAADTNDTAVSLTKLRLWLALASITSDYPNVAGLPSLPSFSEFKCNAVCSDSLLDETEWPNSKSGERACFDLVIGNPPYVSAVEGAKKDRYMRNMLKARYPLLKGAFDIYTAFLLMGVEKTTEDGVYCWIIPNKFLVSGYAEPVLNYMKNSGMLRTVSISDIDAFPGTGIYPIIITGNKRSKRSKNCEEYIADSLQSLVHNKIRMKAKLREYGTFSDFGIKFASGSTGFQAKLLSGYITEHETAGAIPFIVSGSADKFHINYTNVRFMGRTYRRAYISKDGGISDSKWNFWCGRKIVIAGLTREIEAVYCSEPLALGVGVYAISDCAGFDPLYLLGLLNSKFMSWYLNMKFSEKHLAGGYLAINKSTLEKLPLVYANEDIQYEIAKVVLGIQESAAGDFSGSEITKRFMAQLDKMVYGLYKLEDAEVKEIEDFFKYRDVKKRSAAKTQDQVSFSILHS